MGWRLSALVICCVLFLVDVPFDKRKIQTGNGAVRVLQLQ